MSPELKTAIADLRLTSRSLAEMIGVHETTVSRWEIEPAVVTLLVAAWKKSPEALYDAWEAHLAKQRKETDGQLGKAEESFERLLTADPQSQSKG